MPSYWVLSFSRSHVLSQYERDLYPTVAVWVHDSIDLQMAVELGIVSDCHAMFVLQGQDNSEYLVSSRLLM